MLTARSVADLHSQLNAAGQEGWEAVSINQMAESGGYDDDVRPVTIVVFIAWMKRPLGDAGSILNRPVEK